MRKTVIQSTFFSGIADIMKCALLLVFVQLMLFSQFLFFFFASQLFLFLQDFSQRMLSKTHEIEKQLDSLIRDTKATDSCLHSVFNDFLMLSNTQFIENVIHITGAFLVSLLLFLLYNSCNRLSLHIWGSLHLIEQSFSDKTLSFYLVSYDRECMTRR